MKKPSKHCKVGTHEHEVCIPISGRIQGVDFCVHDLVSALNASNIPTTMSCCGHGGMAPSVIILGDGRVLRIENNVCEALAKWSKAKVKPVNSKGGDK